MARAPLLLVCAAFVAACSPSITPSPPLGTIGPESPIPSVVASRPTPTPTPSASAIAILGHADLFAQTEVIYQGMSDVFTITGYGNDQPIQLQLPIEAVTVDFGDGVTATASDGCASAKPVTLTHQYTRSGSFSVTVRSASLCGATSTPSDSASVVVLPAAPANSTSWSTCSTYQLTMSGYVRGFGAGNGGAIATVRNVSSSPCWLEGYPDVVLFGKTGAALPRRVERAPDGAYLFPAIPLGRVALRPSESASFQIAFTDNPVGPLASAAYDVACPPASAERIVLPSGQYGTAHFPFAPCGGWMSVTPFFPGSSWIGFQG